MFPAAMEFDTPWIIISEGCHIRFGVILDGYSGYVYISAARCFCLSKEREIERSGERKRKRKEKKKSRQGRGK